MVRVQALARPPAVVPAGKDWTPEYLAYLQSPEWREKVEQTVGSQDGKCARCGRSDVDLDGHHLSYKSLGDERWYDLIAVCRECHPVADELRKLIRTKTWSDIIAAWGKRKRDGSRGYVWVEWRYFWTIKTLRTLHDHFKGS